MIKSVDQRETEMATIPPLGMTEGGMVAAAGIQLVMMTVEGVLLVPQWSVLG